MRFAERGGDDQNVEKAIHINRGDMLLHLTDLIAEMKSLARSADASMLASILDLAHLEALAQTERARATPTLRASRKALKS